MRRHAAPEERRAHDRAYYAANKPRFKAYFKKWRAAHQEQERIRSRLKYQRDKDKVSARYTLRYPTQRERILMQKRKSYEKTKNPHRTWAWRIQRDFGITASDYNVLLANQHGVCAICKRKPTKRLGVDHRHATKRIRGLLCHSCNIALGLLKDNLASARALVSYLQAAQ